MSYSDESVEPEWQLEIEEKKEAWSNAAVPLSTWLKQEPNKSAFIPPLGKELDRDMKDMDGDEKEKLLLQKLSVFALIICCSRIYCYFYLFQNIKLISMYR